VAAFREAIMESFLALLTVEAFLEVTMEAISELITGEAILEVLMSSREVRMGENPAVLMGEDPAVLTVESLAVLVEDITGLKVLADTIDMISALLMNHHRSGTIILSE
jgi:hypothetical protein